jgi:hypothetical protein
MKSKYLFPEYRRIYIGSNKDRFKNEVQFSLLNALETCENELMETLNYLKKFEDYFINKGNENYANQIKDFINNKLL